MREENIKTLVNLGLNEQKLMELSDDELQFLLIKHSCGINILDEDKHLI